MGNLLRMQLLRDPNVLFVGYRHPHPIKHHILLTVQTAKVGRSESISYTPHSALRTALQDLGTEIAHLSEQVKSAM